MLIFFPKVLTIFFYSSRKNKNISNILSVQKNTNDFIFQRGCKFAFALTKSHSLQERMLPKHLE